MSGPATKAIRPFLPGNVACAGMALPIPRVLSSTVKNARVALFPIIEDLQQPPREGGLYRHMRKWQRQTIIMGRKILVLESVLKRRHRAKLLYITPQVGFFAVACSPTYVRHSKGDRT